MWLTSHWGEVATFSRLFKLPTLGYGVGTMPKDKPITIRDLYPHMSEADLAVAEANLKRYVALIVRIHDRDENVLDHHLLDKRYVALIVRIHDRLKAEGKSWPDPPVNLTASEMHRTIPGERSNSPKKRN